MVRRSKNVGPPSQINGKAFEPNESSPWQKRFETFLAEAEARGLLHDLSKESPHVLAHLNRQDLVWALVSCPRNLLGNLTPQEKRAVRAAIRGKGTYEIAVELGVKASTASTYVQRAHGKLRTHDRLEMAGIFLEMLLPIVDAVMAGADRDAGGRR